MNFFHQVVGVPVVSREILGQRTAGYQVNWVEAFARNHRIPLEWAEKGDAQGKPCPAVATSHGAGGRAPASSTKASRYVTVIAEQEHYGRNEADLFASTPSRLYDIPAQFV